ncbi:sensor histidine kinase [Pontiella agarivorans]|uniref:sensor histidine kinase n=1 Tax=Pontiella agarivorans TaxID=3038953 RepID=UPI002AD33699|nr:sensor histidine kinase [Pontiella agarivorans]
MNIEAQVTRNHMGNGLFLFDGREGIYVNAPQHKKTLQKIVPGQIVRIQGYSTPGGFAPSIYAETIEITGRKPLPNARPFSSKELYSTVIDCDWVSVSGRLISMKRTIVVTENIVIELEQDNLRYALQMPYSPETEEKLSDKMLQQVSFNAVVGTLYNENRQVAGRVFFVNSADDFILSDQLKPEKGTAIIPIHELMRIGFNNNNPVRIHGTVTSVLGRTLTLRGEQASLQASLLSDPDVRVGDRVLLEGYVWPKPIGPAFRARTLEVEQTSTDSPQPKTMKLEQELSDKYNAELVSLHARLLDIKRPSDQNMQQTTLLCRSGNYRFEAILPARYTVGSAVKPGATLMLTGICLLKQHPEEQWRVLADHFSLQLRNADDVIILKKAPWWTTQKLVALSLSVFVLAGFCLLWVSLLRRTVSRQTRIISQQIQKAAVMDERQRIARELHDNLDQGLVGAALQMRSGQRMLETTDPVDTEVLRQTLELAQHMLEHCSAESRSAIHDLRGGILETMTLSEALMDMTLALNEESEAAVRFSAEGLPFRLKAEAERNLLLIAREAATNALRHGAPKQVQILLSFKPDELRLWIQDDGCGFDVTQNTNRFGIQGMHERAARLRAKLTIRSTPGTGTSIEISLPSSKQWNLS